MRTLSYFLLACAILMIQKLPAQNCVENYTDPNQLQLVDFGEHSHWLQPWRGYLETVPAHIYVNGLGINFNYPGSPQGNPALIAEMLYRNGIRHARVEIPWVAIDYNTGGLNPAHYNHHAEIITELKNRGIRPLVLLNAHHGAPNPEHYFDVVLAENALPGATTVELVDASKIVPMRSGFCNMSEYWAAEYIFTEVNGNTATLSKPMPWLMPAGTGLLSFNLTHLPFAEYGTPEYNNTMEGWLNYMDTVVAAVTEIMGTEGQPDKGFDIEIWNELAFGSYYLNINNYFNPPFTTFSNYDANTVRTDLVYQSAARAAQSPEKYAGIRINDGIANTLPWPSSSNSHPRLNAIGKHPYAGMTSFPAQNPGTVNLDANGNPTNFVPTYTQAFPEYYVNALQTEHVVRDMAPINTSIYGTVHGRLARPDNPCPVYLTEIGLPPNEIGITDPEVALALKGKICSRYASIYLNKGAEIVDFFAVDAEDLWLGMVRDNFIEYSKQNTTYPEDDSIYLSPALRTLGNIADQMKFELDPNLSRENVKSVSVNQICDNHNAYQWEGDGSDAHPHLYDRETLAFLPFQINADRWIIHYYVMTRDIRPDYESKLFTIDFEIEGIDLAEYNFRIYDPITHVEVPIEDQTIENGAAALTVPADDYPYLLIVESKESRVREITDLGIEIFPNPASEMVQIHFNHGKLPEHIFLKSIDGKTLNLNPVRNGNQFQLSVKEVPTGTYILELIFDNAVSNHPIIVHH